MLRAEVEQPGGLLIGLGGNGEICLRSTFEVDRRATEHTTQRAAQTRHTQTPSGIGRPKSKHRAPLGRIFDGLSRPFRSNTSRSRAWASRSTAENARCIHQVAFLQADAVLSGESPSGGDRDLHDLCSRSLDLRGDRFVVGVEGELGMQIAVAGVDRVQDEEIAPLRDVVDLLQHLDELGARDDGVVQVVVGSDLGDGAERRLARFPQELAFRFVGGEPQVLRSVGEGNALDYLRLSINTVRVTCHLGQQDRGGIHR